MSEGINFFITLLGTGTPLFNPARACASTLVTAGDRAILIDTGRGFYNNLAASGRQDVDLVLFTHFHSDHIAEFGELLVARAIAGVKHPLPVIGPTGTDQVVAGLMAAYELDVKYRHDHHGDKYSSAGASAEVTETVSGVVYDQEGIKITMFMVDHRPVSPAVGYKFEYQGRVIVISGDTIMVPVMIEQALGADMLIHDTMNKEMVRAGMAAIRKSNPRMAAMGEEMMEYHADRMEVAWIAQEAGVKKLVLTHLVPSIPPNETMEKLFTQGMSDVYTGEILAGRDGMTVTVD